MISEFILSIIFNLARSLLTLLPSVQINVDSGMYASFLDMVSGVLYFLPLNTISRIINIIFSLMLFRIIISIPKAIWDLLPFA